MDVDDLSPVAQDYLKVIWSAVEWGDPPITTTALAARFATSAAAVSATMRRLALQGLVHYRPYHPVTLTPGGEQLAVSMVRRHRLIETFLSEILGYGWDEVHDDAERLEHAASPRFLDRIDALLDHPREDPHGDPIPGSATPDPLRPSMRLQDASPGSYVVIRVADSRPDQLVRLGAAGIRPGALISVAGPSRYLDPAADRPLELAEADARTIRVRPHSPGGGTNSLDHPA
ncbi:MAG: metal-dependent transcriptional regulator [Propioniciclava sp.]